MRKKVKIISFIIILCFSVFNIYKIAFSDTLSNKKKDIETISLYNNKTVNIIENNQDGNTEINSFSKAKKELENNIYNLKINRNTFYCGCDYSKEKKIDGSTCGYIPKKDSNKRSKTIEWEHIVPAETFGNSFKEWRVGHPDCITKKGKPFKGRNCARKVNNYFRYMESDLYNLVPAIGELNMYRSNYSMGMVEGENREFGSCNFEIKGRKIEPDDNIMGDVARTYLYMANAYPGHGIISEKNIKLFEAWNLNDPLSEEECLRSKSIFKIQKNINNIIKRDCIDIYNINIGEYK